MLPADISALQVVKQGVKHQDIGLLAMDYLCFAHCFMSKAHESIYPHAQLRKDPKLSAIGCLFL